MSTTAVAKRQFYFASEMETPEVLQLESGDVAALSRRSPMKHGPNDDSAGVVETDSGAVVLMVADGVGGCPLGHKASSIAVRSVADSVLSADPAIDLRGPILDGIENANRDVLKLGVGAATTLSVVEVRNEVARSYQVGDSMSLFLGCRGALKWKTTSHSPVGYAVESGLLDEKDAMHHDERHLVSNLVGCHRMHIEVGPSHALAPRDSVIVASDGLFDNLHLDEVIELARSGRAGRRVEELAALATQRMECNQPGVPGKPDDLSVLVFS